MTWAELLMWVETPTRTAGELQDACKGLGLDAAGNSTALRKRLRDHILTQPGRDAAGWIPPGLPLAATTSPTRPTGGPMNPPRNRNRDNRPRQVDNDPEVEVEIGGRTVRMRQSAYRVLQTETQQTPAAPNQGVTQGQQTEPTQTGAVNTPPATQTPAQDDTWTCAKGHKVPENEGFCGECGDARFWECDNCGEDENPAARKACRGCGTLRDKPEAPSTPRRRKKEQSLVERLWNFGKFE